MTIYNFSGENIKMTSKTLSYIIIGLCALSIIIGIINTTVSSNSNKADNQSISSKQGRKGFRNIFFTGDKIALISLEGEITSGDSNNGFLGNPNSAESVRKALTRALEDESVKGILLRVDSPGGTVAMSQEIYSTILRIRKKKPVVVSMIDVAASGAYYISSAADRIYADPGTLVGSIGVIMSAMNAQELLNKKLGVKAQIIKSGKYKDIGSPYRPLTQDETVLLQNIVNTSYKQFLNAITEGRIKRKDTYTIVKSNLSVEDLKKYADGRVFTGDQAKALGFVDQLGGLYEAHIAINKMSQTKFNLPNKELPLVPYNVPSGVSELVFGASQSLLPGGKNIEVSMPLSTKYRHQPLFVWE